MSATIYTKGNRKFICFCGCDNFETSSKGLPTGSTDYTCAKCSRQFTYDGARGEVVRKAKA